MKGKKLGSARPGHWTGKEHRRGVFSENMTKYHTERSDKSRSYYAIVLPSIRLMRSNGNTLAQVAEWLNSQKLQTISGGAYTQPILSKIVARYIDAENILDVEETTEELAVA